MKSFLQLAGLRPDPFGSSVEESKNFPDSIEGKDDLDRTKKAWEKKRAGMHLLNDAGTGDRRLNDEGDC